MLRQSVNSAVARDISAGDQLQASRPAIASHISQPRLRRASEYCGTAGSSVGAAAAGFASGRSRLGRLASVMIASQQSNGAPVSPPTRRDLSYLVRARESDRELGDHFLD